MSGCKKIYPSIVDGRGKPGQKQAFRLVSRGGAVPPQFRAARRSPHDAGCEGWLYKKGGGQSRVGRRNWKRRWFALRGMYMSYSEGGEGQAVIGTVFLYGAKVGVRECRRRRHTPRAHRSLSRAAAARAPTPSTCCRAARRACTSSPLAAQTSTACGCASWSARGALCRTRRRPRPPDNVNYHSRCRSGVVRAPPTSRDGVACMWVCARARARAHCITPPRPLFATAIALYVQHNGTNANSCLLERDKARRVRGANTRPAVLHRLVRDRKLAQVPANHLRLCERRAGRQPTQGKYV